MFTMGHTHLGRPEQTSVLIRENYRYVPKGSVHWRFRHRQLVRMRIGSIKNMGVNSLFGLCSRSCSRVG